MGEKIKKCRTIITVILALNSFLLQIPETTWLGGLLQSKIYKPIESNHTIEIIYSVIVIVISILIFASVFFEFQVEQKKHKMKKRSKKFNEFFKEWYSKDGKLTIVCDDLNGWFEIDDDIYLTLKHKGNNATVYLSKMEPAETIRELENNGVKFKKVSKLLTDNYSFSYLKDIGNISKIIVRDKRNETGDYIVFKEFSDRYISTLLDTLLEK